MDFWGIPADEELKNVQDAVVRLAVPWDQVFDPKGYEGKLWTLFNVEDQPNIYVFDREGRIVVKRAVAKKLDEILQKLTQEQTAN